LKLIIIRRYMLIWGADGWPKNQLGERRLGEFFFGRQINIRNEVFSVQNKMNDPSLLFLRG